MAFVFVDDRMEMVFLQKMLDFPKWECYCKIRKTKEAADMVMRIHTRGGLRGAMAVAAFFLRKRQHKASIVGA